jgi:alpha-galactosidase
MARNLKTLSLVVSIALMTAAVPRTAALGQGQPELLTPKASPAPHINGPKVYGARPGHPFLYRIPCTGTRPIRFTAKGLPRSLKLDENTGIISGKTPATRSEYEVTLLASNSLGKDARPFKIVVGDTIGLTPQMGWNDWYTFYEHPTDAVVRKSADAMIASGMADYGYQYIDIDDAWQRKPGARDAATGEPVRDKVGAILPTAHFPDMFALTAYIHSLGLKAGIYTSPGPQTCAGREGSLRHEEADAKQYAAWGFDLLKYDMCSYGDLVKQKTEAEYKKPYAQMGAILKGLDRDVVFNLCQYGVADVWTWARQIGGNSWRTTGDVGAEPNSSLPGFYSVGFANAALNASAGPGGFNDPDYILIGTVGDAHNIEAPAKPTNLTPDEQYSYMSMWSLMASPLFYSGDMATLDPFTLNILCNSEIIDIDQDSLGKQAIIIHKSAKELILAKPLEDGSIAVGLFNLTEEPASVSVTWKDLARTGRQTVRDVWRHKDVGTFEDSFESRVAPHGATVVRMTNLKKK